MSSIRAHADQIIDTSDHTVHTLRSFLLERFSLDREGAPMRVQVMSFGHKYGNPGDLELLFDVRHLPNPHFVPELKRLSGHDSRVVKFLRSHDEVKETLKRFTDLLSYLLPLYKREGKVVRDGGYWLHRRAASVGDDCQRARAFTAARGF